MKLRWDSIAPFGRPVGARCVNDGEHVVRLDPGNDLIKGIVIDALSEIGDRVKTVRFEIEHVTQPFMHVTNLFERSRVWTESPSEGK